MRKADLRYRKQCLHGRPPGRTIAVLHTLPLRMHVMIQVGRFLDHVVRLVCDARGQIWPSLFQCMERQKADRLTQIHNQRDLLRPIDGLERGRPLLGCCRPVSGTSTATRQAHSLEIVRIHIYTQRLVHMLRKRHSVRLLNIKWTN